MPGVARRLKAGAKRGVVARELAFGAQAGGAQPAERVKPVERGRDVSGEENGRVVAANMRGLMGEYSSGSGRRLE